ncbi:hypothetical protein Rs2_17756 [Raphanus sativus]|nr:hypothetical protein Rs2_17756 [Raphanus sativus]
MFICWWLTCGDKVIGYWPGNFFTYLKHSATAVQWGGEVYTPNVRKKPHTKTTMGSGRWPSYLFGEACFHTNVRIKDYSMQIKYPPYLSDYSDEYDCYSTKLNRETYMSEPVFYFGGPGQKSFLSLNSNLCKDQFTYLNALHSLTIQYLDVN